MNYRNLLLSLMHFPVGCKAFSHVMELTMQGSGIVSLTVVRDVGIRQRVPPNGGRWIPGSGTPERAG